MPISCSPPKGWLYLRSRAAGDAGHHDDAVLARMLVTMALDMSRYKEYSESIVKEGRKYGR